MRDLPHLLSDDARLAAVAQYQLADCASVIDLDAVVELGARLFDVPIVLISIIAETHQFVKAKVGVDICELDNRTSFCAHALGYEDMMVVPDAREDARFADNPFVVGDPNVRFYAGLPLRAPGGVPIGTLCVIDREPRGGLSETERQNLRTLADLVIDKLELRRLAVAGAANQSRFEHIASTSPDGIVCADADGRITFWNRAAERLFGFAAEDALGSSLDLIVPERMRGGHAGGMRRVAEGGVPKLVGGTVELDAARADGTEFPVELSLSMWRENDVPSFGAIIRDVSERRANEQRLYALAHLDALTGLANRSALSRRIMECVATDGRAAILMLDLDGFKDVNDTLGHSAGDAVLKEIGRRIGECTRGTDLVARLGGDEFAVLMTNAPNRDTIGDETDCLLTRIGQPILIDDNVVHVSASVGIALFPTDGAHVEDLLSAADLALYQAKNEGRNCRRFFHPRLREAALRRRSFEAELRRAISSDQFELHYQPQVRLADGRLLGVEALLRWRHPTFGLIAPDRFLASAEMSAQAADLGQWVLERACADAMRLRRLHPDLRMGVNLFGSQFRTGRLADEVGASLEATGLPPQALELEITENIILRHDETMLAPLHDLRGMGVGVAFDDFGTGFASLSFLKRFPLTRIKIDRSFVAEMCDDLRDAAIINATVYLAAAFELDVVAEGVETEQQAAMLQACGCRIAQGFLYGRPMPIEEMLGRGATRLRAA